MLKTHCSGSGRSFSFPALALTRSRGWRGDAVCLSAEGSLWDVLSFIHAQFTRA